MRLADERDRAFDTAQRLTEAIPANVYAVSALRLEDREGYPFGGDWMAIIVSRSQLMAEEIP